MKQVFFCLSNLLLFSLYANIIIIISLSVILGVIRVLLANFSVEI